MAGLHFDPVTHVYTLDGLRCPSVTGVLRRAGLIDYSGVPSGILESARLRGTRVHAALHYFNEDDLDVNRFMLDFPECAGYLQAWINFTEQRRFRAVLNERRLASRRHQLTGTADCFGYLDDVPVLLDFATGRPQDVAKDLQTAAYHAMALEWARGGDDPELQAFLTRNGGVVRRYGVALRKDGTFALDPYTAPQDWREFLLLLDAQRVVERKRPRLVALPEVA